MPRPSKLCFSRLPTCSEPGQLYVPDSGARPLITSADVDDSLKVDPGANCPATARDTSGTPAFSSVSRDSSTREMPPTKTVGSYVGVVDRAMTRPVCGSITTAAPLGAAYRFPSLSTSVRRFVISALSAWSAIRCTSRSRLVTSVSPRCGWVSRCTPRTVPRLSTVT